MTKTPEEVKKGLELIANYCQTTEACEDACPYVNECDHSAKVENVPVALLDDVARLLYQLEQENAELREKVNAAVKDLRLEHGTLCLVCKHFYRPAPKVLEFACREFGPFRDKYPEVLSCSKFEWRGMRKENGGARNG